MARVVLPGWRRHVRWSRRVVIVIHPHREVVIQTPSQHPFTIITGNDTTVVTGRPAAVEEAKQISRRTGRPIRLERKDGRVTMEFRRGHLEAYAYETRGRGH
ncbi:MAG: hypothetical protein H6733_05930 [Alphaproteobacteria bacterium]|nr:hypothetical protein [Alphaproteobacteria bacterium]